MSLLTGIAGLLSGLMIGLTMIFHIDTSSSVKFSEWMQTVGTVGAFATGVVIFAFDVFQRRRAAVGAARVSAELLLPRLLKIQVEIYEFGSRIENLKWSVENGEDRAELRETAEKWLELLPSSEYAPLLSAPNNRGLTKSLPRALSNIHTLIQGNSLPWESENDPAILNPQILSVVGEASSHISRTIEACRVVRYDAIDSLRRGYLDGMSAAQRWQQNAEAAKPQPN